MEPAGGVTWPASGAPREASLVRYDLPSSPSWEPPLKKVRNEAFQATPNSTFPKPEFPYHARREGVFSPKVSPLVSTHAAGEHFHGGQESFGPLRHGETMTACGGQQQMPINGYSQEKSHAGAHGFNIYPQGSTHATGFPPGSAKSTGCLFLKTKLCTKFKLGTCNFNERCHFAHGMEDLRKPPVDWGAIVASVGQAGPHSGRTNDGNLQRKKSTKPCRFLADGKECPYGDRCTFVHVSGGEMYPVSGFGSSQIEELAAPRLKTRMCAAWERGEACNYGERCHYAHGSAELQRNIGGSAYTKAHAAPVANTLLYSNSHLEAAPSPYSAQLLNTKKVSTLPAAAPVGQYFPMANNTASVNTYPNMGTGAQQPINAPTMNLGHWSAAPVQGGFQENQTAGLWTGHTSVEGGYSQDPSSVTRNFPAHLDQHAMFQSYALEDVNVYQESNQSMNAPYGQDGGNGNYQIGGFGDNGSCYATSYSSSNPN